MAPRDIKMARSVSRKHAPVVYSPSSYFRQKVARAARSVLTYLRRTSIAFGAFIVWLFGLIKYLNVLPSIARVLKPQRQLRKTKYEATDSMTYVSGFWDRIVQFLSTESVNKKRLLKWVRVQSPHLHHVNDLSSHWCDGTTLSILIDSVVPGTCPRHDLLRRDHAANNCRLALRLVQKNLGIRELMTPEEMADPKRISETKMLRYIISIKNASCIAIQEPEVPIKLPEAGALIEPGIEKDCSASGSGLVVAVIDKRARFNITTQTYKYKNLYVEITGPNKEKVRRKIMTTKANRGYLGQVDSSQSSKDEQHPNDIDETEPIPLDYQIIKSGSYQVNYIPKSLGMYQVAITWGGEHIKNSPFKVRSTTAKNIEQTAVKGNGGVVKAVSFQDEQDMGPEDGDAEFPSQSSDTEGPSTRSRRQSLVRQAHISTLRDSYESTTTSPFSSMCSSMLSSMDRSIDTASDVFLPNHQGYSRMNHPFLSRHNSSVSTGSSRSGSILSRSSSIMHSTDRPSTVKTRRKVIRRIIKGAGGTEEVTYPNVRSSSILSSSQMSSMGSSLSLSASMSIDDRSPKFSSSSSSSGTSFPGRRSPRVKAAGSPVKYADRMAKLVLGKAYNELSKQGAAGNSAALSDTPAVKDLKENQRCAPDEKPPTGKEPNKSMKGHPSLSVKNSHGEDQPQTHHASDNSRHPTSSGAGPQATTPLVKNQNETEGNSNQTTEQTNNSADINEYLRQKHEFLRGLGGRARQDDSRQQEASKNVGSSSGTTNRNTHRATGNARSTDTPGPVRRFHKKRKEDKATQCTAQDIKNATGWVSRRSVYRNAHVNSVQKDSNGDSALGESEGSVVNSSSDKDNPGAKSARTGRRSDVLTVPAKATSQGPEDGQRRVDADQGGETPAPAAPVQHRVRRRSNQGRQSTLDSGFSDENGPTVGPGSRRDGNAPQALRDDPVLNVRPESGQDSTVQDAQSEDDRRRGENVLSTTSDEPSNTMNDNTRVKDKNRDQTVPIQIVPPTPITKLSGDLFGLEAQPDLDVQSSSDNDNNLKVDVAPAHYLNVDILCQDSSTAPTPGDSSVGNISSPDEEILASAECKSNDSSGSPDGETPAAVLRGDLVGELGTSPGGELPSDGETLDDVSLDAMLRTLENDPDYSTREFLRKYHPMMGDDLGIVAQLPTDETDGIYQAGNADVASYHGNVSASKDDSLASISQPIPERCHASGVGLFHGIVGEKNNFQVRTSSAGDGSLSVTIRGPRPHTVNETNVVYTGDDHYEVIYDVSLAGFYVISVKWAEKHVPDSPFIVKVTF